MKNMDNGATRLELIRQMLAIVRRDAPWIWGLHPKQFTLEHAWLYNNKPHNMANNTVKYLDLDPVLRAQTRQQWNPPVRWPVGLIFAALVIAAVPATVAYLRRERQVER
jgi:hypothetical protein